MIELENSTGFSVGVHPYGASWISCRVPLADGTRREVLLGCTGEAGGEDGEALRRQEAYLGACIGRFAGRLRNARLTLGGRLLALDRNDGAHCLHGGPHGFGRREWAIEELAGDRVRFSIVSPDGEGGFPGQLTAEVRYSIAARTAALTVEFLAAVDRACPVSLTNHAYFNLDGSAAETPDAADCRRHRLHLAADRFLPIDADGVPDGEVRDVAGTPFDFRFGRTLDAAPASHPQLALNRGYNHAFILDAACRAMTRPAAQLAARDGALAMRLYTTLPALQLYTGNYLGGVPARAGSVYADYAGVALEAQFPPDAPNHAHWPTPDCILHPGNVYRHAIRFEFSETFGLAVKSASASSAAAFL
jgi:aldose 1-epimerase